MHVLPSSHTARMPGSHLVDGIMLLPQLIRVLYNHISHSPIRHKEVCWWKQAPVERGIFNLDQIATVHSCINGLHLSVCDESVHAYSVRCKWTKLHNHVTLDWHNTCMQVLPSSHTARKPESHLIGGIMLLPELTRVLYSHITHYHTYNYNSVEPECFVRQLFLQFACDQRKIREYHGALHGECHEGVDGRWFVAP